MRTAASTITTAAAIQRPTCRTGTAVIASGRPPGSGPTRLVVSAEDATAPLAGGPVDRGVVDGARLDPPLLEDRLVLAVGDQRLHAGEHRLGHPVALRDRDPVRRRAVRLAGELELAVGP